MQKLNVGKSLKIFPTMPFSAEIFRCADIDRLINEETAYDVEEMKNKHDFNHKKLNAEQQINYDKIIHSVSQDGGQTFFVHGSGSCGKILL